jgi:hypothetical protein
LNAEKDCPKIKELKITSTFTENPIFQNQDGPPNTSHSMPLVKEWLTACQRLHPECNHQSDKFIPTRLIDLQGSNPRLRLSSEFKEAHVHYATLSHCWGTPEKESCKLTKSTLPVFMSKITMEELLNTFRDAIEDSKPAESWILVLFRLIRCVYILIDTEQNTAET